VWLPWVTLAHIDSLVKLADQFGTMAIAKVPSGSNP
jgi:hypothetical protein